MEITDWGTHGQTLPMGAGTTKAATLLGEVGSSPIGRETPVRKTEKQLDGIRRTLEDSARLEAELILRLTRDADWDVLIACFSEHHRGGHTLWCKDDIDSNPYGNTPLLGVYRAVDTALERIKRSGHRCSPG